MKRYFWPGFGKTSTSIFTCTSSNDTLSNKIKPGHLAGNINNLRNYYKCARLVLIFGVRPVFQHESKKLEFLEFKFNIIIFTTFVSVWMKSWCKRDHGWDQSQLGRLRKPKANRSTLTAHRTTLLVREQTWMTQKQTMNEKPIHSSSSSAVVS